MYRIHLGSGLPEGSNNSFFRQLNQLKKAIERSGHSAILTGPGTEPDKDCSAVILLGYPDQFPWLAPTAAPAHNFSAPVFLWAQFSKPPHFPLLPDIGSVSDSRIRDRLIHVPLTRRTGQFLEFAGLKNIGPVIPHGVDTAVFHSRKESDREKDVFTVGSVGAHTLRKRFRSILESFALFCDSNIKSRLLIKTDAVKSRDGEDLAAIAVDLGIGDKVEFNTENLTEAQLAALYKRMDVYLNLSEWEGFCIPVIEAMACGVPVIAQEDQGPGEIIPYGDLLLTRSATIEDGGSRLLLSDADECAAKLNFARNNPGILSAFSGIGSSVISDTYDINIIAARWLNLIEKFQ